MTSEPARRPRRRRSRRFEFAPHNCFACGTLNTDGLRPRRSTSSRGRSWTELDARPPLRGLGGHRPRRDPVHDPRRGHGLGPRRRGQLGRDGPDDRRLPQAGRRSARRSARRAGSPASRRRIVDTAGRIVDAATGAELATADRRLRRAPTTTRKRELRERYGFRCSSRGDRHARTVDAEDAGTRPPSAGRRRDAPGRQRGHRPRRRLRRRAHSPRAEALGAALAELTRRPRRLRGGALRAASPALADPEYLAGQQRDRARDRRRPRRPLAAPRGRRRAASGTPPASDRPTPLLFVADRLFREPELEPRWFAFGLLERTLDGRDRSGPGSSCAAPPARPATGSPSTRSPTRTARASSPSRTAGRSSSSSSTRRRAGSAASSARRSPRCRTSTGAAGRDPEVAAPRASPLLGQLIGDAEPDVQKALSWALRSLAAVDLAATTAALRAETAARRRHGRRPPRLGHPRHASPSSTRRSPPSSATASPASASAPARRRPRPRPRPPPASAACRTRPTAPRTPAHLT